MTKKKPGPTPNPSLRRQLMAARVKPDTLALLKLVAEETGQGLGKTIDAAVGLCRTQLKEMIQED